MTNGVIESGTACGAALMEWLHSEQETALFHFVSYGNKEMVLFTRIPDISANRKNVEIILSTKLTASKLDMQTEEFGEYDRQSGFLVIGFPMRVWLPFGFDWALTTNPKIVSFSDVQKKIQKFAAEKLFSLCETKYPNRKSLPPSKVLGLGQYDMDVAWLNGTLHTDFVNASMQYLPRYKTDAWFFPLYMDYLRGNTACVLPFYGGNALFEKEDNLLKSYQVAVRNSVLMAAVQGYHWLEKVKKYRPSKKAVTAKNMYARLSKLNAPFPWKMHFRIKERLAMTSISEKMNISPTTFYYGLPFSEIGNSVYRDTNESCEAEDCITIDLEQIDTIFDAKGQMLYKKRSKVH